MKIDFKNRVRNINSSAFTLFELLIAISISSLVAMGLFSLFSSVTSIRDTSVNNSENTLIIQSLTSLFQRDFRMMSQSSLSVDSSFKPKRLKFTTQNSLRFNKAMLADIVYYIDDDNWLVRRESNTDTLYEMDMRLIPNVTEIKYEFYDGNEYKEDVIRSAKMMRISLMINEIPLIINAARTVENL